MEEKGIIVNVKHIVITAAILASAGGAMAVEATQWNPPSGQLTRAEVKAELLHAIASGELERRNESYAGRETYAPATTTLTRAEVKEELARARANGELQTRNESYGVVPQPVRREGGQAFAWRKSHATQDGVN